MSTPENPIPWTPPEDAVCIEKGCTLPPAGLRPGAEDYILSREGEPETVVPAGSFNEIVCAVHMSGPQPIGKDGLTNQERS